MNTNFDFSRLKDKTGWKRALAFFLSMALLFTGIMIPDSPLPGAMTARASASGEARGEYYGEYYMEDSFPISYLEQEEIHEITTMGNLDPITSVTWYQFTPAETALYTFRGNIIMDEPDTYGSIYTKNTETGNYELFASNDDAYDNEGYYSMQFSIMATLTAGTTYYLCAAYCSLNNHIEYMPSFNRSYITNSTQKINGIEKKSATVKLGKSYVLEADVTCIGNVTPTYKWYTYECDDDWNYIETPLSGTGGKYTFTVSASTPRYTTIYCKATAETDFRIFSFDLTYDPIQVIETYIDGEMTNYCEYQINHTYKLQIEAMSSIGGTLTYTWKKGDTVLQTGKSDTLLFTTTKQMAEENGWFDIYCEISDDKGSIPLKSYIYFEYSPIADVKRELDGEPVDRATHKIIPGTSHTLKISAVAEQGKTLTYEWTNGNGDILGREQTYQYTMDANCTETETIYCTISDGTAEVSYVYFFIPQYIGDVSLTVNGSSASGNAIPVHVGESYQLKASAKTTPGKTLTYQWGTMADGEFTALSGKTGDTYTCSITKAEDVLYDLVCRISDPDGNVRYQNSYMRYRPIYNIERFINGMPLNRITAQAGQKYALSVKAVGEPGKTLKYTWYANEEKVADTAAYTYTAKDHEEDIYCEISDSSGNDFATYFYITPLNAAYDFTINGVSTTAAYAYEGQTVTLNLIDKQDMAGCIYWSWGQNNNTRYKKQITVTMGKEILKGYCRWEDDSLNFTLLPCTSHTYTSKGSKAATASADGSVTSVCTKCGYSTTTAVAKISNIKLSKTSLDYTGKNQSVTLTVQDRTGKQLKAGVDYDYTFNGKQNAAISVKDVGQYAVKVVFKGNYSGSSDLTFTVNPPSPTLSKVTATKKGFKATWKKSKTKVTGYEICYSTNKSFKKKGTKTIPVKGYKTTSKTVKKLKAKTKYFVKIRAYQNVKVGKKTVKLYSKWSSVKNVKTRK